jgi:hypothetical protein
MFRCGLGPEGRLPEGMTQPFKLDGRLSAGWVSAKQTPAGPLIPTRHACLLACIMFLKPKSPFHISLPPTVTVTVAVLCRRTTTLQEEEEEEEEDEHEDDSKKTRQHDTRCPIWFEYGAGGITLLSLSTSISGMQVSCQTASFCSGDYLSVLPHFLLHPTFLSLLRRVVLCLTLSRSLLAAVLSVASAYRARACTGPPSSLLLPPASAA